MIRGSSKHVVKENERSLRNKGLSERDAVMASLKRSKADKKRESNKYRLSSPSSEDYPYGTRIELDNDSLDKLGIDDMPDVGKKMRIHAVAHVLSTSESTHDGKKAHRSMSLQIRKMKMHNHDDH